VIYAKQCKFHDVTVRGYRCERTDHPDGRRDYFQERTDGSGKLKQVPEREKWLRDEIDAAVSAKDGVTPTRPFDDDWAPNPNDDQGGLANG
jgi:hypothetical protein